VESDEDKDVPSSEPSAGRRPYTPPRIEESGRFEHMVLTCAFATTQSNCNPNRQFPTRMPRSIMGQ
jgi:hypothetical protein